MNIWEEHDLDRKVVQVLESVHLNNPDGHHFGRPYVSAYQIVAALEQQFKGINGAIGKNPGGIGAGAGSLANYIAKTLSTKIKKQGETYPIEGIFMSNEHIADLVVDHPEGQMRSSSLNNGRDMAMFRYHPKSTQQSDR